MRRLLPPLLICCSLLAIGSQAGAANIDSADRDANRWSTKFTDPIIMPTLNTQRVEFQDRLLELAEEYTKKRYVPYIWGGGRIGEAKHCYACRECVKNKRPQLKDRLRVCRPCRACGIDCSHFVYRMFTNAGLDYDYASSWELSRQTPTGLLKHYNLVNIGRDLTLAQPGDILVYKRHVTMLTKVRNDTHGDIVHASRFRGDRIRLGGFRWDRNIDVVNYRGSLVRILRHKDFFTDPRDFLGIEQVRWKLMPQLLWTGINP